MRTRNRLPLAVALVILGAATGAQAQASDSLYRKAQDMVANGDAVAGRALVDSLLHATSPDSASYANGLYWHAGLAASAAEAELDYRRIIVDYPTSSRVEDALLRIGQLELTRGEYDEALQHLQRIPAEHPSSPLRAKASYWIARTFFEKNDAAKACAANADAATQVTQSDVELKNQIDYQQQRCRDVAVAVSTQSPVTPVPVTTPKTVASSASPAVKKKHDKVAETKPATTPLPVPAAVPPVQPSPVPSPPAETAAVASSGGGTSAAIRAADTPSAKAVAAGAFSVQVAAYYDRAQADTLAAKLRTRGYPTARVEGTKAPFRVRIGQFKTYAAAAKFLATLKAKKITGFVAGK